MTTIAVVDIETDRFEGEEGEAKVVELACVAITDEWVNGILILRHGK